MATSTNVMYRFEGTPKVYGPKPLKWFVEVYSSRPDCEGALGDSADESLKWRPASDFEELLAATPLTTRQASRLRNLGVDVPDGTSTTEAQVLIRAAESKLPPTKRQIESLRSAGLSTSGVATRGDVERLLEQSEIDALRVEITKLGGDPSAATDFETLEENVEVLSAIRDLGKDARKHGLTPPELSGLDLGQLRDLEIKLDEFWSAARDLEWLAQDMFEEGLLRRMPSKAEREKLGPELFRIVTEGDWDGDVAVKQLLRDFRASPASRPVSKAAQAPPSPSLISGLVRWLKR